MTSYHYDIEIFPNYACFTFIPAKLSTAIVKDFIDIDIELLSEDIDRFDYESNEDLWLFIQKEIQPVIFEIGFGVNTLKQMVEFLTSDKKLLIGYNNSEYDDVVLDLIQYHLKKNNGIIKTDDVYRYSKRVIGIQSSGGYTRWSIEELSHFESLI